VRHVSADRGLPSDTFIGNAIVITERASSTYSRQSLKKRPTDEN
jgi:hypothetical protein